MPWQELLTVVNTADTVFGLIFLATSYAVWRKRNGRRS